MSFFWTVQIIMDFAILSAAIWFLWKRRTKDEEEEEPVSLSEEKIESLARAIRAKASQWDQTFHEGQKKVQNQLQVLSKICEQAAQTLERARLQNSDLSPSEEERELVESLKSVDTAPKVKELQMTDSRLKSDLKVDLRTVLRDQLT